MKITAVRFPGEPERKLPTPVEVPTDGSPLVIPTDGRMNPCICSECCAYNSATVDPGCTCTACSACCHPERLG